MLCVMADERTDIERLSDLELVITFLQRTLEELNEVVLQQQRQIERQEKELAVLKSGLQGLADSIVEVPRRPEDEKPPHY